MKRDPNVVFEGAIPENYDRYLGPVIFEPYAKDLAARARKVRPKSVLEIACGTGIVTRMLCDSLGPEVRIIATDLNPGMLVFARKKFNAYENVNWQEADAEKLPFQNGSFDAVICQFGLMFVPDKQAAMREAYRVLGRGGVFLFNVWDAMERNPYAWIAHRTIGSFFKTDPPTFYQIPFSFYDDRSIRELLRVAGFSKIEAQSLNLPCSSVSAGEFATGLARGNPVASAIQERGVNIEDVIDALGRELAKNGGAAPFQNKMQAIIWSAVRE